MNNYELNLPPDRPERNAKTGRYLKGHVPYTKGKKWSEWAGKRAQKRMSKGWKNLDKYRCRGENAGRDKKAVIGVTDDGRWAFFPFLRDAGDKLGVHWENIGRCCRQNARGVTPTRNKANTDHKYKGVRWYFETDKNWMTKIKKQ